MKAHLAHPVSALAGATVVLGACLLSGMQSPAGKKEDILRHMTIVCLDDGQGGMAKTIRFTGVNVQVVNGVGNPLGFGDDRTGSHNFMVGLGNNYTNFGGFVGPHDNMSSGPYAAVTGGTENL